MNIPPLVFNGLLDHLAGRFEVALPFTICTGSSFGFQMANEAKEFFTVAIIPEELDNDLAVLGVLDDDSAYEVGKASFTFVIFIDRRKLAGNTSKAVFSLILSHEICHFAFYYELFFNLGCNNSSVVYNSFIHTVSGTFDGIITQSDDPTHKTNIDEHKLPELIFFIMKYPLVHFTKGYPSGIDYREHLIYYLDRLEFKKELEMLVG